jgi:isopentenyl-diphosphate delta-isomerase
MAEELGVTELALHPAGQVEYRADVGGGMVEHEVVDIFRAEAARDVAMAPNPDEVMDTAWIALADLSSAIAAHPADFTPWLRIYVADHADRIFGAAPAR